MPLLSLPADILLEIFSLTDEGGSLSTENASSTLAAVSLVCKQLCALAHRPLLKSLRWDDKKKTNLNLNQWLRNPAYMDLYHVPKKLVVAVDFDFEAQSLDARNLDNILHERIYTRLSSFSSLSSLVFSNTSVSAQYLYPILLSLPMLRSLALLNVTFAQLTHDNEADDTLSSVLNNYPFTSLQLTHLALRGVSVDTESTYEHHPINFLRVPSLLDVEITWTSHITAAYMRHIHPKMGFHRQSGATGWPNIDIPCTVLESSTSTEIQQQLTQIPTNGTPLPLVRLARLTLHVPMLDRFVVRALKVFLTDCAQHPSFDPPLHFTTAGFIVSVGAPQDTLLLTLLVDKCRVTPDLATTFQGCLAPVVRYEGPVATDILSLFMDPKPFPLAPTHALNHVSLFHSSGPTEAEEREIDMPGFRDVLHGLRALNDMSPVAKVTPTTAVGDSGLTSADGIKSLEVRVQALDNELLYGIEQLFGPSIERIIIRYAYHDVKSANTLMERIPDILSRLPQLRSFIFLRISDPSIVFARRALERHAAIVGSRQWFRWPGHQIMGHPPHLNPTIPNQFNALHPHWAPAQTDIPEHLLTLEQFKQHTATLERAIRMGANPRANIFRLNATREQGDRKEGETDDDETVDEEQEVRDHITGWGRICGWLWEVQIENYRFVRRYGEIGERWGRVPVLR